MHLGRRAGNGERLDDRPEAAEVEVGDVSSLVHHQGVGVGLDADLDRELTADRRVAGDGQDDDQHHGVREITAKYRQFENHPRFLSDGGPPCGGQPVKPRKANRPLKRVSI